MCLFIPPFYITLQEAAPTQFRKTGEKTTTLGYRLDSVFHLIRLGLFYMDHDMITRNLEKAQRLEITPLPFFVLS
jgi:hypothetical protein